MKAQVPGVIEVAYSRWCLNAPLDYSYSLSSLAIENTLWNRCVFERGRERERDRERRREREREREREMLLIGKITFISPTTLNYSDIPSVYLYWLHPNISIFSIRAT